MARCPSARAADRAAHVGCDAHAVAARLVRDPGGRAAGPALQRPCVWRVAVRAHAVCAPEAPASRGRAVTVRLARSAETLSFGRRDQPGESAGAARNTSTASTT